MADINFSGSSAVGGGNASSTPAPKDAPPATQAAFGSSVSAHAAPAAPRRPASLLRKGGAGGSGSGGAGNGGSSQGDAEGDNPQQEEVEIFEMPRPEGRGRVNTNLFAGHGIDFKKISKKAEEP